jgi:phosphoglycolate phosphatase-like HAD superfamily hydrolase
VRAYCHVTDAQMKTAFKSTFNAMAKQYPIYGLNTEMMSPNDWWLLLIRRTLSAVKIPKEKINKIMPELGPSILDRFSSEKGYRLAEGVTRIFSELRKMQMEKKATSLRWNVATNSDYRILLAMKSLGLDKFINLGIKGQSDLELIEPPRDTNEDTTSEPCLSYFLESEKPHRKFFHKAVRRSFPESDETPLSELCAQTLYVGDSLTEDYEGAKKAGLQAVWLQRYQEWPSLLSKAQRAEVQAVKSILDITAIIEESWS